MSTDLAAGFGFPASIWGVVRDGLIVPSSPLPEGTRVEIHLCESQSVLPPDLAAEFSAWDSASARALELIERLADEDQSHEAG